MCLAYDPVQQLLAIGTEDGTVLLYPTSLTANLGQEDVGGGGWIVDGMAQCKLAS